MNDAIDWEQFADQPGGDDAQWEQFAEQPLLVVMCLAPQYLGKPQ